MTKRLYLLVTKDEFELPLAVTETVSEMAEITGRNNNSILGSLSHFYNDNTWCPFRRVDVEWEEDEI